MAEYAMLLLRSGAVSEALIRLHAVDTSRWNSRRLHVSRLCAFRRAGSMKNQFPN